MTLTTQQILILANLNGVGGKTIFKIGEYAKDNEVQLSTMEDFLKLLKTLKLKVKEEGQKGTFEINMEHLTIASKMADRTIDAHKAMGIGVVSYYEPEFPAMLRYTIDESGKPAAPMYLFYKGDLSIANMPCLAVIGTREVTTEGISAGEYLSSKFAELGLCIVSGLAIGCDTCGHKGALMAHGKTIAFLAHGLDSVYPEENTDLASAIVENGGLLMSEYPVGMKVNRYNLVARDRLQAGLANATLVIQTGINGGTMHAANATLKAGKPLYIVYFKDDATRNHEKSLGNELLVKKGAKYVSGKDDLTEVANDIKGYKQVNNTLF